MRIAYLECFSGISGDMFLGALVDAGVPPSLFEQAVEALNIGARLEVSRVVRGGISATKVDVYAHGEKDLPREQFWEQRGQLAHPHEHSHGHKDHRRAVTQPRTQGKRSRAGAAAPHIHDSARGLSEIRQIIEKAAISGNAKATAIRVFEALG